MKVYFYTTASGRQPVSQYILGLNKKDQGRFSDLREGLEAHGLDYDRAEFRVLRGKLWEIKFQGEDGSYRVAYVIISGEVMVWLHAFRKDGQRTPRQHIELALKRMKEVLP